MEQSDLQMDFAVVARAAKSPFRGMETSLPVYALAIDRKTTGNSAPISSNGSGAARATNALLVRRFGALAGHHVLLDQSRERFLVNGNPAVHFLGDHVVGGNDRDAFALLG